MHDDPHFSEFRPDVRCICCCAECVDPLGECTCRPCQCKRRREDAHKEEQ